jgi:hypothetical protein
LNLEVTIGPMQSYQPPHPAAQSHAGLSALVGPGVVVLSDLAAETVIAVGDCLVVVLSESLSVLGVNAIRRGLEWLEAEHGRCGYLSIIPKRATHLDDAARKMMGDVVRRHTHHIDAAAMVVGGTGFRATVVRSIITGIHLASSATHPLKVFATLDPALDWYTRSRPNRITEAAELRHAVCALGWGWDEVEDDGPPTLQNRSRIRATSLSPLSMRKGRESTRPSRVQT